MKAGKTGVTNGTPKNILFGAGTIHKNLRYNTETHTWNFEESIFGATSGGSKLTITPELVDVEVDGVLVATKGLKIKTGETVQMELNLVELTSEIIRKAVIGKDGQSEDENYDLIESKADIEEGDYLENIAFVGKKLDGKHIIVIMDNVLCTNGFEAEGKNKEAGIGKYTFVCHADLESECDTLPYHIYYPKTV